jgi:hypothetical protein
VKLQQANSKFEHTKGGTSFTLRQTQADGEDEMLTIVPRSEEVTRGARGRGGGSHDAIRHQGREKGGGSAGKKCEESSE